MTTIVTRVLKGSPLSWNEADANFTNLNTDKLEVSTAATTYTTKAANLSDLADAATARTNLGISATNTPNTPAGSIAATTVQAAINELDTEKAPASAATAAGTSNTPAGNIVATNVQAAINELDTEKLALSGGTVTGQIKGITPVSSEDLTRKDYVDGLTATSFVQANSGNTTIGTTFTAFPTWSKTSEINGGTLAAGGGWNPPIKGIYQINYAVNFASSGVTAASIQAQLRRNGTVIDSVGTGADSTIYPVLNGGVLLNLLTTDTVDIGSLINVGTAANVSAKFTATLVRPVP